MNRKHNPLVSLVALLLALLLVIICAGCGVTTETPEPGEPAEASHRFTYEHVALMPLLGNAYIITDHDTGVEYLVISGTNAMGMTVLQEKEG